MPDDPEDPDGEDGAPGGRHRLPVPSEPVEGEEDQGRRGQAENEDHTEGAPGPGETVLCCILVHDCI